VKAVLQGCLLAPRVTRSAHRCGSVRRGAHLIGEGFRNPTVLVTRGNRAPDHRDYICGSENLEKARNTISLSGTATLAVFPHLTRLASTDARK